MYLGVDIGSTNCKFLLWDGAGTILASWGQPTPRIADEVGEGFAVPAQEVLALVVDAFVNLPIVAELRGIGITGQMHGLLLQSANDGRALTDFKTWQDQGAEQLLPGQTQSARAYCQQALAGSGLPPQRAGMALPLWFNRKWQGHLPNEPYLVTNILDFVASRLADCPPATDPTNAAAAGGYDVATGDWSAAWLQLGFAGTRAQLPAVRPTGSQLGQCLGSATKVYVPIGDFQAAALGAGLRPGELLINVGTGAQVATLVAPEYQAPHGVEVRPFYGEAKLACVAGLPGGKFIQRVIEEQGAAAVPAFLLELAQAYQAASSNLPGSESWSAIRIAGGPFHKNQHFGDVVAGVFGRRVLLAHHPEEAALGAALLAANADSGGHAVVGWS